jgi:hypothetical protein
MDGAFRSEQVDSPEELLKTMVGAIAIKDRIDRKVFHPDSAIAIRGLQPFECVFIAVQRCVDLSQPVGKRNATSRLSPVRVRFGVLHTRKAETTGNCRPGRGCVRSRRLPISSTPRDTAFPSWM